MAVTAVSTKTIVEIMFSHILLQINFEPKRLIFEFLEQHENTGSVE